MGKRPNTLREYHLLIIRKPEGFTWEVRYGRHAKSAKACCEIYQSYEEAMRFGRMALEAVKEEVNARTGAD